MKKVNLNHCKGKRLWGQAQSSIMKSFTASPRFLFNRREEDYRFKKPHM